MSEQWGPWIEHDGMGCPVRGMVVQAIWFVSPDREANTDPGGFVVPANAGTDPMDSAWIWRLIWGIPSCLDPSICPIIRYRIRKPRGMVILEEILEKLPEPVSQ